MNTPLYKRFKNRGTSTYIFPSSSEDLNTDAFQNNIQLNFTKFVLLNIPSATTTAVSHSNNVLQFTKTNLPDTTLGENFYNWDPNASSPTIYGEQFVESLRNYVANHDSTMRNSKISNNKGFYNVSEKQTPTEMIFWKWCKKLNIIDFEPALHKIDWDKNLADFDNPNANVYSNSDYFRKYLWKERDVNYYIPTNITNAGNFPNIYVDEICKFKVGDFVKLSGVTGPGPLESDVSYEISSVSFPTASSTLIVLYSGDTTYTSLNTGTTIYLDYQPLIQYVGEIQATSKTMSSQKNYTEFTAMIPSHCGKTPTVLFKLDDNLNYYPGLELPILATQIQPEILGAEYLISPIRTNPSDYPGSYFGYFDSTNKTYTTSAGDRLRYNGDYYGISKTDNSGVDAENYVEKLTEFTSDSIDGLSLDFDYDHYYKMNLPDSNISNFDEFNSLSENSNPPSDFDFNTILWYYEIVDSNGNVKTNLYGVEFLNNPDNDFGTSNDKLITPIHKLVSNDTQDGTSYIFNLNLSFSVDNDMLPLKYDPTAIYNAFGFDLYNNIMSNYGKLNDSFINIVSEFIRINQELLDMKSLLWSQTDIDSIKKQLSNFDSLLKLYSTMQIVNSDTVKVEIDYSKNYPTLSLHSKSIDYDDIYNLYSSDLLTYSISYSGDSSTIYVPNNGNKFLVNIFSNIVNNFSGDTLNIALDKDLFFKQTCDIIIKPDLCVYTNKLNVYVMYSDGYPNHGLQKKLLAGDIYTPVNVQTYDTLNPTGSTLTESMYYNLTTTINDVWVHTYTGTTINQDSATFKSGDWVYIDSLILQSGTTDTVVDMSGVYYLSGNTTGVTNQHRLYYNPDTYVDLIGSGLVLKAGTYPKISYYLGMKISILRINSDVYSDIPHRYSISKQFLTNDSLIILNNT